MICKNCGTTLTNNNPICPKCGYNNAEFQHSHENPYSNNQNKPHKKNTIVILTVIIACILIAVVCGLAVWFVFFGNTTDTSVNPDIMATEETTVPVTDLEIDINDYYISGGSVSYIADPENPVILTYTNQGDTTSNPQALVLDEDKYAFDGKTIYCHQTYNNADDFYKYTFVDKTTLVKSLWVTKETLQNNIFSENTDYDYGFGLSKWEYYDGYIYASRHSAYESDFGADHILTQGKELPYLLIKISTDGNTVKTYKQVAYDFAIKDDWIYLYDNGIDYIEKNINDPYQEYKTEQFYDAKRCGIYKMKTDGSGLELLKVGYYSDKEELDNNIVDNYSDFTIIGDYLYCIDSSPEAKGNVCRMNLDGSNFEYITEENVFSFTVDPDNQILYYSLNLSYENVGETQPIKQISLSDKTVKDVVAVDVIDNSTMKFYNNSIYFCNSYIFSNTSKDLATCGARYNLSTGKIEYLQRYYEIEEIPDDIFSKQIIKGPFCYWEEATDSNGYFQ